MECRKCVVDSSSWPLREARLCLISRSQRALTRIATSPSRLEGRLVAQSHPMLLLTVSKQCGTPFPIFKPFSQTSTQVGVQPFEGPIPVLKYCERPTELLQITMPSSKRGRTSSAFPILGRERTGPFCPNRSFQRVYGSRAKTEFVTAIVSDDWRSTSRASPSSPKCIPMPTWAESSIQWTIAY